MKRFGLALSLLLVAGLCLACIAPTALAQDAAPPVGDAPPDFGRTVITWTPPSLTVAVAPGEERTVHVSFASAVTIARATFVVSFPLSRSLRVSTPTPFTVVAGQSYTVDLAVSWPAAATDDRQSTSLQGTVHVMGQFGPLYQAPLLVTVTPAAALPPIAWTPEQAHLSTDDTSTLPRTIDVEFTTSVAITGARLRATPPLDRVLDLSMTGPLNLQPGVVYRLTLTAHPPAGITAVDDVPAADASDVDDTMAPVRALVSGNVQIYTPLRVYQRMLPVTVALAPPPVVPTVTWRPPLLTLRVPLGDALRQVVTATTNVRIEAPTLRVSGAISPFVSAAFVGATPGALLPLTPYQLELTVRAPIMAVVNRPLTGGVAIVDGNGQELRYELKVALMWQRPTATPTPVTTP